MRRSTIVTLITGLVIGAAADALVHDQRREETMRSQALVYEMASAGLCANALRAMDRRGPDHAAKVLEERLKSATWRAYTLSAKGATLPDTPGTWVSLVEGFRRGSDYLRAKDGGPLPAWGADVVLDRIADSSTSPAARHRRAGGASDSSR